jgi:hypothetical protein
MKKLIVLLALTSLFTSNIAFAISDTGENSLGVYFDFDTFEVNCYDPIPSVPASMYFVMANCTQATIGSFQFSWMLDPDPIGQYLSLGQVLPQGALNLGTENNLIVGMGVPLVTGSATVLVESSIMWLAHVVADITVGPSTPSSIPGNAVFNDGIDPSLLFTMNFATVDGTNTIIDAEGWVRPGVGSLGCVGPVLNEELSWGGVKALYR